MVSHLSNFFSFSLMLRQNKLDCLSLASFFVIVYDFWVRLYLRCARSKGRLLALLANIKLSRKKLARYKHSSLFVRGMSDEEKKILHCSLFGAAAPNLCNIHPGPPLSTSWTTWSQGSRLQFWLHLIKLRLALTPLLTLASALLINYRHI